MAITILPNEENAVRAQAGADMFGGLNSALGQLAQYKMNQLQRHHAARGLSALGIPQEQAQELAFLPPELQGVVLKNYLAGAESAGLEQALAGLQPGAAMAAPGLPGQPVMGPSQQSAQPEIKGASIKDVLARPRLSPEMRLKVEALKQKREEISGKESLPTYKKYIDAGDAAKSSDMRLNRMEELVKKGSLPYSSTYRLFKSMAEDPDVAHVPLIGGILQPIVRLVGGLGQSMQRHVTARDMEEFEKLSTDFIKDSRAIFGGRITEDQVKTFLQTVPTLSQSDAGKLRLIQNLRAFNKGASLKAQAAREIVKENGGKRPANLDILVDERIKPELDSLAMAFQTGINL